jgi:hypothetical protein
MRAPLPVCGRQATRTPRGRAMLDGVTQVRAARLVGAVAHTLAEKKP